MKQLLPLLFLLSAPAAMHAQDEIPLLLPEEREVVKSQSDEFNRAISPVLETAAQSTVRIWAGTGSRRLAYGTVVGDGSQVLTKWSEIAGDAQNLRVDANFNYSRAFVAGVYEDDDLAVLNLDGDPLIPVKWSNAQPQLGSFVATPQPDGRLAAFGVVSVLERNLRDTDMAFLGVYGDPDHKGAGVRIERVDKESGAFDAGLKRGQVILKVGDRSISGVLELKNALTGVRPGDSVALTIVTAGKQEIVDVVLGNRPSIAQFSGDRLRVMERMGGPISEIRDSFTHAIQSDMKPKPNQIGGPVVDLKGNVIGITTARADRTRSFIMPSSAVVRMLAKTPEDPEAVIARADAAEKARALASRQGNRGGMRQRVVPPAGSAPRATPPPRLRESDLKDHQSDVKRFMDFLDEELGMIEDR